MKDPKIRKLFEAAQKETAAEVPPVFPRSVISAIRREASRKNGSSLSDQLGALFPRVAWVAIVVIGLCVGAELYFSNEVGVTSAEVTQVAEEWLSASN
jgi:hypothetical protein